MARTTKIRPWGDSLTAIGPAFALTAALIATASSPAFGQDCRWTLTSEVGPSPRNAHALSYDSARDVTVLFGGYDGNGFGDTWEWDGREWRLVSMDGPHARWNHVMTYDSARNVTVLFGGWDDNRRYLNDTWEWDGRTWRLVASGGPAARRNAAIAFDEARGVSVLFGGHDANMTRFRDTWTWDGRSWSQINAFASPSGREGHAMTYDSTRRVVVLFGGADPMLMDDTWEWNGTTWNRVAVGGPAHRMYHVMAYDRSAGMTLLFGGEEIFTPFEDAWGWDGARWTLLSESGPGRNRTDMVYDRSRQVAVLFGGWDGRDRRGDTWEFACRPAVELDVIGECPGRVTVSITGATPNANIGIAFAARLGNVAVPTGPCAGTRLGLGREALRHVTTLRADANGEAMQTGQAPPSACGGFLQALDVAICEPSNVANLR